MNNQHRYDLRPLTGLRGLAAWLVVLYHVRTGMAGYAPEWLIALFAKGYLAVDLFFILSGFVMWLTYGERFATSGLRYSSEFLVRRIARIWPLHAVILCGAIAFAIVLELTGRPNHANYPFAQLPLHFLLMQNWGFLDELTWNHPAWSISTEMGAYLLFPFIAALAPIKRMPVALLISIVVILAALLHAFFRLSGYAFLGENIPHTGLIRCLLQFTIGIAVCAIWLRWRTTEPIAKAGILLLIGSSILAAQALAFLPETFAVPLGFATLLLALALTSERSDNPLGGRVLHYLGEVSYATYLVHFMFYILFKLLFVNDPENVSPALLALYMAMTFILSAGLYHLVEKPAQRWINMAVQPKAAKTTI